MHVETGRGPGSVLAAGLRRPANTGQVKFPATVKANLISAIFDGENATHVTMPAAKNKLEQAGERLHKSWARCRRSQLPFASSQSRRERTLARARAMEQSAAP